MADSQTTTNNSPQTLRVSVKWQKMMFPEVEIDTSQPPYVFKRQLYDLTGVPPKRQKIMVKGGLLKDDAEWSSIEVKEGQRLMMMGTADKIVKAPEKDPVFIEDLPENKQVVRVGQSAGLFNLGNTCYMNSTIQCLHSVPELKSALLEYSQPAGNSELDQASHLLTIAMNVLFGELDNNVEPVAPSQFWLVFRKKFRRFGQLLNGCFMQQDAEECWTQLLDTLSQTLRSPGTSENISTVKHLFGIELASRVYCQESGEKSMETESTFALKCHISQDVNHLHEGLKLALKCELKKNSLALRCSANYLKESCISGLPRYLTIQFVRFSRKSESNQKTKILRKVDYPLELDVYDLCSDELKMKLEVPRQILRDEKGKKPGLKPNEESSSSKKNDVKMVDAEGSSNESGISSTGTSQEGMTATPSEAEMHSTGVYDLVAVLTHKGRSADSGHYVAWVKEDNGNWIEYDDDIPTLRSEEEIVNLSGGGDRPTAYICMYKARVTPM